MMLFQGKTVELIECESCTNKISPRARTCPECGDSTKTGETRIPRMVIGAACLLLALPMWNFLLPLRELVVTGTVSIFGPMLLLISCALLLAGGMLLVRYSFRSMYAFALAAVTSLSQFFFWNPFVGDPMALFVTSVCAVWLAPTIAFVGLGYSAKWRAQSVPA